MVGFEVTPEVERSERKKPLLKALEMSYAPGPDHDGVRIKRSVWFVSAGDGIKAVAGEDPHILQTEKSYLAPKHTRQGSLGSRWSR